MLRTLLDWLLEHTESIVRVALRDTGKTHSDAVFGEILTTASKLRWVIDNCERVLSLDRRPCAGNWRLLLTLQNQSAARAQDLGGALRAPRRDRCLRLVR